MVFSVAQLMNIAYNYHFEFKNHNFNKCPFYMLSTREKYQNYLSNLNLGLIESKSNITCYVLRKSINREIIPLFAELIDLVHSHKLLKEEHLKFSRMKEVYCSYCTKKSILYYIAENKIFCLNCCRRAEKSSVYFNSKERETYFHLIPDPSIFISSPSILYKKSSELHIKIKDYLMSFDVTPINYNKSAITQINPYYQFCDYCCQSTRNRRISNEDIFYICNECMKYEKILALSEYTFILFLFLELIRISNIDNDIKYYIGMCIVNTIYN